MSTAPVPEGGQVYRSSSGTIALIVSAAFAVFLLGDAVVRGSWGVMLLSAPWVLLVLWAIYEVSVASFVRVDRDGVRVRNMLRTTSFPWARVKDIDFRWQLVFLLDDGKKVTCMGGPSRSRPARNSPQQRANGEVRLPAGVKELTEIRERWMAAGPSEGIVRRSWDAPALIALAVIVVWAVIALLLTRS